MINIYIYTIQIFFFIKLINNSNFYFIIKKIYNNEIIIYQSIIYFFYSNISYTSSKHLSSFIFNLITQNILKLELSSANSTTLNYALINNTIYGIIYKYFSPMSTILLSNI